MSGRHPCGFGPACLELDRQNEALEWYLRAAAEAPYLREPWVELARLLYQREEWDGVLYAAGQALAVRERPRTYICEPEAWGSLPHDLRRPGPYHKGPTRAGGGGGRGGGGGGEGGGGAGKGGGGGWGRHNGIKHL